MTELEILERIATSSTRPRVANKARLLVNCLKSQAQPARGNGNKSRGGMGDRVIIKVQRPGE